MEENRYRYRFVYPARGTRNSMVMWDKIIESMKDDKVCIVVRRDGNVVVMTEEKYKELLGGKKNG